MPSGQPDLQFWGGSAKSVVNFAGAPADTGSGRPGTGGSGRAPPGGGSVDMAIRPWCAEEQWPKNYSIAISVNNLWEERLYVLALLVAASISC